MKLTTDERAARARQRMIEVAKQYQSSTYCRKFVSPLFQRMIRAEAAVGDKTVLVLVDGELEQVHTPNGWCACVTCGKVDKWDAGLGGIHCGHFLASRRNSILFEEDNVAPQCSRDNVYLSGAPQLFRKWMLLVRGIEAVERLEWLSTQSRQFDRESLVDMRISYKARLDDAVRRMQNGH